MIINKPIRVCLVVFSLFICNLVFATDAVYLNKVILTGLTTLSSDEVLKQLNLPSKQIFEPELGSEIGNKLQTYLSQKGYYFAIVNKPDIVPVSNSKVNLVYNIEEGIKGSITNLGFHGNRYFSSDKLKQLIDLKEKQQIELSRLPLITQEILNLYTSRGYLFAQVSLDSLIIDNNQLSAVIYINEGPLFKAEKVIFIGNKVTSNKTILKISGINQITQFTPQSIIRAENALLKKTYIRNCKIIPLDAKTLGIEITETKMTKAEGIFGIGTNPNTNKRNLSGYFNIQFLNLWGTDRAIAFYWRSTKSTSRLLQLSYHESGLNKYPFTGDILLQREQQDNKFIRTKAEVGAYYNYRYHKFGTSGYSETIYPDNPDSSSVEETNYLNLGLHWEFSDLDYVPNPSAGYISKIKSGWLFSKTGSNSRSVPINELDFESYISLVNKFVYKIGIHFREISDQKAKEYEQYKLGGFKSLRGYNEDEFSSWRIGWINSELGYLMTRDSRLFFLFDNGLLQTNSHKIKADLFSTGLGLSFAAKLGIMSVSYALSIDNIQNTDFRSGMLHLGLISSF